MSILEAILEDLISVLGFLMGLVITTFHLMRALYLAVGITSLLAVR